MLNYIKKPAIYLKMAYFCYFSLKGNLDFIQKSFITSTTRGEKTSTTTESTKAMTLLAKAWIKNASKILFFPRTNRLELC